MSPVESTSQLLARLKGGDESAAQVLWERYFHRLVTLARARISAPRAVRDEEDLALSAFDSFCRGVAAGRFPRLDDRNDLWKLLIVIVSRKAADHAEAAGRQKRGGPDARAVAFDWSGLISSEPTPAFVAEVADECERLLGVLDDEQLRSVAVLKMEGYTTEEIAQRLKCVPRTIERKLRVIRETWRRDRIKESP